MTLAILGLCVPLLVGCAPTARTTEPQKSTTSITSGPTTTTLTTSATPPPATSRPPATSPTSAPTPATSGVIDTGVGWTSTGLEGPSPSPGTCRYRTAADGYALPDPRCTPGAVNTGVTQGNITTTICSSGYTAAVCTAAMRICCDLFAGIFTCDQVLLCAHARDF